MIAALLAVMARSPLTPPPIALGPDDRPNPDQRPLNELAKDAAKGFRLLWLSCGDRDGLVSLVQRLHAALKARGVPRVWHVEPDPHEFTV